MRIINKKYLLIIILVGIILTGVIFLKPKENVKLDNVVLKQEVNNKTFAMYKEDSENNYIPVTDTKFPEGYALNVTESNCIDNNGNEIKNALSYENGEVTITSGKTIYCYLYFDKTLGVEIKEKEPKGLKTEKVRGEMYRFQGQATDTINNYICFGTSNVKDCTDIPDKYMYRIIGIEAKTGRVKVIKMKALKQTYQWYTDSQTDIEFPQSKIYEAIKGDGFLTNKEYVPEGWEEKISDNTWIYGDMLDNDTLGARQNGEGLYLVETGKKETIWDAKANAGKEGAQSGVVENPDSPLHGQPTYYIRHTEKWNKKFDSKISLMYLHDYNYSISDDIICQFNSHQEEDCKAGWMHLSQNDPGLTGTSMHEWTMSRRGWGTSEGYFRGFYVDEKGYTWTPGLSAIPSVRPVFYIRASEKLLNGTGTITDPFIIK